MPGSSAPRPTPRRAWMAAAPTRRSRRPAGRNSRRSPRALCMSARSTARGTAICWGWDGPSGGGVGTPLHLLPRRRSDRGARVPPDQCRRVSHLRDQARRQRILLGHRCASARDRRCSRLASGGCARWAFTSESIALGALHRVRAGHGRRGVLLGPQPQRRDRHRAGRKRFSGGTSRWRCPGDCAFKSIEPGCSTYCGLTDDGRIACWGRGRIGELGAGHENSSSPVIVPARRTDARDNSAQHGACDQGHERERPGDRRHHLLPLPQLVEVRARPAPCGSSRPSRAAVGSATVSVSSAPASPAPCITTSARLNPASSPVRADTENVRISPESTAQQRARRDDRLLHRRLARARPPRVPARSSRLAAMPATIAASPPPSQSVKPSRWTNSQNRITRGVAERMERSIGWRPAKPDSTSCQWVIRSSPRRQQRKIGRSSRSE